MLFSVGTLVSTTNKTDRYDITEILMLIGTDFIGSCKSNYLAMTTITALYKWNVMRMLITILKGHHINDTVNF